ncbi:MAG: CBS domain-containing protein [Nitrospirota bacterium]
MHGRNFLEMEQRYPEVLAKKAAEIMVRKPLTVSPETPILEAASYMGLKNFRRMPVVEQGKLVGMVSIGAIHRGLFFSRGGCELESEPSEKSSRSALHQ